ncbi:NAD(P)H-dependent oxidoreductase [Roseovarius sp. D22-M7]|uniref:NAD(P)H-dependent oxidoreductase n=1 Tax=Roseovarius sp. D22-M7 TaxID=3127116 RepID=UPI0030101A5E
MARRIAVIQGHPDPEGGHFCHALADAYRDGASAAGHAVDLIDTARMDLPYIRNKAQWDAPPTDERILQMQRAVGAADHLLILYPLWLGDMPAVLKSALEHLSCGGFVMAVDESGHWQAKLKGKSARVVVTMGMPALVYRLFFLSHSLKSLERNILKFAGVKPVRTTLMGQVDGERRKAQREAWLAQMRRLGSNAA